MTSCSGPLSSRGVGSPRRAAACAQDAEPERLVGAGQRLGGGAAEPRGDGVAQPGGGEPGRREQQARRRRAASPRSTRSATDLDGHGGLAGARGARAPAAPGRGARRPRAGSRRAPGRAARRWRDDEGRAPRGFHHAARQRRTRPCAETDPSVAVGTATRGARKGWVGTPAADGEVGRGRGQASAWATAHYWSGSQRLPGGSPRSWRPPAGFATSWVLRWSPGQPVEHPTRPEPEERSGGMPWASRWTGPAACPTLFVGARPSASRIPRSAWARDRAPAGSHALRGRG